MTDWLTDTENQKTVMDTVKAVTETFGTAVGDPQGRVRGYSAAPSAATRTLTLLIGMYATFKVAQFAARSARSPPTSAGLTTKMSGRRTAAKKLGLVRRQGRGRRRRRARRLRTLQPDPPDPRLGQAMKEFGGTIYDVATNLGLIKDPMAQFEGKADADPAARRADPRAGQGPHQPRA